MSSKNHFAFRSLFALASATVVLAVPAFAQVTTDTPAPGTSTQAGQTAVDITYDTLPVEVRRSLDAERGDHKILGIQRVVRGGNEMFYLATIALTDGRRNIRINEQGRVLRTDDIRDADLAASRQTGGSDNWYRQREDRDIARRTYWAQINLKVTATPEHPERVAPEDVPPMVVEAFVREAGGRDLDPIFRYRDSSGVVYQTSVPDGPGKVRVVQVATDGAILDVAHADDTAPKAHARTSRTLEFADMPRPVKDAIDSGYPKARIPHIEMVERGDQRYYNIEIDDKGRDRYLVIREDGKILTDIVDRDYSASASTPRRD